MYACESSTNSYFEEVCIEVLSLIFKVRYGVKTKKKPTTKKEK